MAALTPDVEGIVHHNNTAKIWPIGEVCHSSNLCRSWAETKYFRWHCDLEMMCLDLGSTALVLSVILSFAPFSRLELDYSPSISP